MNLDMARAAITQEFKQNEIDSLAHILGQASMQTAAYKQGKIVLVKKPLTRFDFEHRIFGVMWMMLKAQIQDTDEVVLSKMAIFCLKSNCFAPAQADVVAATTQEDIEFPIIPPELLEVIFQAADTRALLTLRIGNKHFYSLVHVEIKKRMRAKKLMEFSHDPACFEDPCRCVQDFVGINPVKPSLPLNMETVGVINLLGIRSTVVGNASHIFFVAAVNQRQEEEATLQDGLVNQENRDGDHSSDEDVGAENADSDSLPSDDDFLIDRPFFKLLMYDRHTLEKVKDLGTHSRGCYTRVQVHDNTLMCINRTHFETEVILYDISVGANHYSTISEGRVLFDVISQMYGNENQQVVIDAGDLVKDALALYITLDHEPMVVIYKLDTSKCKMEPIPMIFDITYMYRQPLKVCVSDESICTISKDVGNVDGYTLFWQDFKTEEKEIKTSTLKTNSLIGEFRVDKKSSSVVITCGTSEDFFFYPGGTGRKVFHDMSHRPTSRLFFEKAYYSFSQNKVLFIKENHDMWQVMANGVETGSVAAEYTIDPFGILVQEAQEIAVYRYPLVMRNLN